MQSCLKMKKKSVSVNAQHRYLLLNSVDRALVQVLPIGFPMVPQCVASVRNADMAGLIHNRDSDRGYDA